MADYNIGRVGMRVRGAYDAATSYDKLDVVTLNGCSYVAKEASLGVPVADANKWMLLCGGVETTDYFTEEVATGSNWVNGKMIYSKMYVKENAAKGTFYALPIGVEYEMAWLDPSQCFCVNSNGNTYPLSYITNESVRTCVAYIKGSDSTINVMTGTGTTGTIYARLLYTKPD